MNRLSIGAAWEETLAFVKREGTLLFPVALLFLALPGVVLQLLLPDSMHQTEPMKEISATSQLPPQFLLGMGVVILMAMLGALALYALALRPGISVAEAIQLAFRRLPVLIGSALLLVAGFIGIAIVLSLIGGIVAGVVGIGPAMSALVLVTVPILLFFSVRLILLNAVVLHEPVNSVEAIRHSWRLSAGLFWKLLGFVFVLLILVLVVQLVSQILFGIMGSVLGGSILGELFAGLGVAVVSAIIQVYYLIMTCRIYRQLAER